MALQGAANRTVIDTTSLVKPSLVPWEVEARPLVAGFNDTVHALELVLEE